MVLQECSGFPWKVCPCDVCLDGTSKMFSVLRRSHSIHIYMVFHLWNHKRHQCLHKTKKLPNYIHPWIQAIGDRKQGKLRPNKRTIKRQYNKLLTSMCPEMNIEVIVWAESLATVTAFSWSKNFQLHFSWSFLIFFCRKSDMFRFSLKWHMEFQNRNVKLQNVLKSNMHVFFLTSRGSPNVYT